MGIIFVIYYFSCSNSKKQILPMGLPKMENEQKIYRLYNSGVFDETPQNIKIAKSTYLYVYKNFFM